MPDAPLGDDRGGCTITRVVPYLRLVEKVLSLTPLA